MRALEVFGSKLYLTGPSDHRVDAPDGTSESMLSSGISRNIFIWVLVRVGGHEYEIICAAKGYFSLWIYRFVFNLLGVKKCSKSFRVLGKFA